MDYRASRFNATTTLSAMNRLASMTEKWVPPPMWGVMRTFS